ncbi:MAG: amidohydrolase, partial [Actinomycetota bacterium]
MKKNFIKPQSFRVLNYKILLFLLFIFAVQTQAQITPTVESGKFRLHKFEQEIGEETYEITRTGDSLLVKSNFKFTDRGSPVPLTATLKTKQDLTPESFEIKGSTARGSTIDTSIQINGNSAVVREGKETRTVTVPANFFTIAGYAPTAVQQMMMRYLINNKIKGSLETLPSGAVTVEKRGTDQIKNGDKTVALDRYIVSGLIWGRESIWLDGQNNLVALVGVDAEFDHFEALRDGYESALATFVDKAAADGMASLADLSKKLSPEQKGVLAITNANVIDGTGNAPLKDAVIVIENGRITSIGARSSVKIPKSAKTFDAQGKYVVPGLFDMHAHF